MRVKKLPKILALHLKRFKYMEQLQRYTKLSYRVVFPIELRLFNTVSGVSTAVFIKSKSKTINESTRELVISEWYCIHKGALD